MIKKMRQSTLETLGLKQTHEIFKSGHLPVNTSSLIIEIFGDPKNRGSLVISGANGIVGAGKAMQLSSRLCDYGVKIVALDFPNAPDGIGSKYSGLEKTFGKEKASQIMSNIIRLTYDGNTLPTELKELKPCFLLEAIPEILEVKKAHYKLFKESFPDIEIMSVTSGFPSSELNVGIAHPAFPHEINKVFEISEKKSSKITHLLWALGLIPTPVSDDWSFVLDVLFCGLTLAGLKFHETTNMPFWKIDKNIRKLLGPNPFRAHDAIGAKGANFLTWSCLHHLSKKYAELFKPTDELIERKENDQNWYPLNHFRPIVNWTMSAKEEEEFKISILGPLFQMTSLMLHENRSHLSNLNAIGELCAQFRKGILAYIRDVGYESVVKTVESYHKLNKEAKKSAWYPKVFEQMENKDWGQLYVNAEHDGNVGVITISRESYNNDVNAELNKAIDWLKEEGIESVIVTGDFHLSTQMVGADTSEFYPALKDTDAGEKISITWSETARRLNNEFNTSIGFINGKRCLGGFLELLMHCHYFISVEDADIGMPEITLPVVPGMEGCHWPFRKTSSENWPKLLNLILSGRSIKAKQAVNWLLDYVGPMDKALETVWQIATNGDHGILKRKLNEGVVEGVPKELSDLKASGDPNIEASRNKIMECIQKSCASPLSDAIKIQAKYSADFMTSPQSKNGKIWKEFVKVMSV